MYPKDLLYTENHEWLRVEEGVGTMGITDYAQNELGDIVFVELPEEDEEFSQGDALGVVESVKAVSDIYTPVSGTIVEGNEEVLDAPELVNSDPYGEGWLVKIRIEDESELDDLLDAEDYQATLE
ncbi:MAG: glycine cleavage system protein GcvH [Clostridia bacterium]